MGRKLCENCGAPYEDGPEDREAPRRCGYCGASLEAKRSTLFGLRQPRAGSTRGVALALGAVISIAVIGIVLAVVFSRGNDDETSAAGTSAPSPVPPPPVPPPPAPPPPATPPPAAPPRERTVHDEIRDFFLQHGGRLCVAGNLSRFGPFAGSVQLTVHPEGRVSQPRVTMQPAAPAVARCMEKAFSHGPVYRGRSVGVVYHFSGGRSADGLQYRDGIELQGSAE